MNIKHEMVSPKPTQCSHMHPDSTHTSDYRMRSKHLKNCDGQIQKWMAPHPRKSRICKDIGVPSKTVIPGLIH